MGEARASVRRLLRGVDRLAKIAKRVEVAHPGHLRLIFKSKRKNDVFDAEKLAKILYLNVVPRVHVPAHEGGSYH